MIFLYLIIFILLCLILVKSGGALVKIMVILSHHFKLTEYVLAFILMTFATTLPELLVGIASASRGLPIISLSNIIGSNIINLTFILGLVAVVAKGLKIESKIAKKDSWIIFFIALIPMLLGFDGKISRPEGFILMIVFGWYIYHILKQKDAFKHRVHSFHHDAVDDPQKLPKTILVFIIVAVALILSAFGIVEIAKLIAASLYIHIALVGLILVAIGTSLPELTFGIKAAIVKHEGLSLGNIIGSVVINSTFVIGLTAVINPIQITNLRVILIGGGFMMAAILLANVFLASKNKISLKEAWILIGFYVLFLIAEFIFK